MTRRSICAVAVLCALLGKGDVARLPAAPPAPKVVRDPVPLAIQKAVFFLRNFKPQLTGLEFADHRLGKSCLIGLAMLESGVPANDPYILEITSFVMQNCLENYQTYEVALVLMFLDRLGNKADIPLMQYMGVRLLGGQGSDGTWTYSFADPMPQEPKDLERLKRALVRQVQVPRVIAHPPPKKEGVGAVPRDDLPVVGGPKKDKPEPKKEPEQPPQPKVPKLHDEAVAALKFFSERKRSPANGDHSNTQFGSVGLWVARKHGVPVDQGLDALDKHYRGCQSPEGGWSYSSGGPTPSMTSAGLIGLIVAIGARDTTLRSASGGLSPDTLLPKKDGPDARVPDPGKDEVIKKGLTWLGRQLHEAVGPMGKDEDPKKPRRHFRGGTLGNNLYMLWSIERVAVTYGLKTIGNVDWYACSAEALVSKQMANGSWNGSEVDTCFALLVLTRANFASDLTDAVKGKIRDPAATELSSIDPMSVPKVVGKGTVPKEPPAKVDDEAKAFSAEADRLANALVAAVGADRDQQLTILRDAKGAVHTEALLRAIRRLDGDGLKKARDALAIRLTRMTGETLRDMLKDRESELRRAASLACAMKEDRGFVPDLIAVLADKEGFVSRAARAALKALTQQDFGPETQVAADVAKAQATWRDWWKKNSAKQ